MYFDLTLFIRGADPLSWMRDLVLWRPFSGSEMEGRDEFTEAESMRFRFQGMAVGLRTADMSAQFVPLPSEPPIAAAASNAIPWTRWLPGALLTAFFSSLGGWLILRPESAPDVTLAEPVERVLVAASSPPSGGGSVPSAQPTAPASTDPQASSSDSPVPSSPVPPQAETPGSSPRGPRRPRRSRTRVTAPVLPGVKPVVSLINAKSTGNLNSVDIRVAIDPLRPHLRGCLAGELERGKNIRQTLVVRLAVRGPDVDPPIPLTTMLSPRLWSCIRTVLTAAKFRGHQDYSEVTLSLQLGPP